MVIIMYVVENGIGNPNSNLERGGNYGEVTDLSLSSAAMGK